MTENFGDRRPFLFKEDLERFPGFAIDAHGLIHDRAGLRWIFANDPPLYPFNPRTWVHKPDFVASTPEGAEILRISRKRALPSEFAVWEQSRQIGHIRRRGLFHKRYYIDLLGDAWTFHIPLFTVRYWATSSSHHCLWTWVARGVMDWGTLLEPQVDERLIPIIAFIHREWLYHT